MKSFSRLLISAQIAIICAACASPTPQTATPASTEIATPTFTSAPTPMRNLTPISTKEPDLAFQKTIIPLITLTPIPSTATTTPAVVVDLNKLPPLSKVVFTNEDIKDDDYVVSQMVGRKPYPPQLDLTSELTECQIDCVKRAWNTLGATITIIMIRTPSSLQAKKAVIYQLETFKKNSRNIYIYNDLLGEQDNTWSATGNIRDFIFASTRDSVFVMLLLHLNINGFVGDIASYAIHDDLVHLSQLQLKKLEDVGYPP